MNLQAAMEAARFTKLTFEGCDVRLESRVPPEVRAALAERGHQLDLREAFADTVGGGSLA